MWAGDWSIFRPKNAFRGQKVGRKHGPVPLGADELLVEMFKEMDSRFMHWVLRALLGWRPTPLEGIPVRQIHGRRDLLIPARRVEADEYISGGGHMINVTHASLVNSFITRAAAMSQKIIAFREDAVAYCEFIDSLKNGKPEHFYERLITCLSRLAKSADELPTEYYSRDVENDGHEMTCEEWDEIAHLISDVVNPEIYRLAEANKDDSETISRVCMFWDYLADIYRDLRNGIRLYNLGEDGIKAAIWQWKEDYNIHWGLHLFDALHTAHRIKHELYED